MWGKMELLLASGLSRIYRAFRPPLPFSDPRPLDGRPIAIFSTAGIGDTLTDTVAVRAVRETFPKSRLIVVVHEKRREVLEHNPHISRLVFHSKRNFLRTLGALKSEDPFLSVVLRANDPDIFPLAYTASRRVLANPRRTRLPHLVTIPVDIPHEVWDKTHGVEQTLKIVAGIGATTKDKRLVYAVTDLEQQDARDLLAINGVPLSSAVAVQVTRRRHGPARDWPMEHYKTFLSTLRRKHERRAIVILGGAAERDIAEELAGSVRALSLAGQLTLRQSAAVLAGCACLVTPDTGLMHLSFAVGCRTLCLLSILPPGRVGPYGYPDLFHQSLMPPEEFRMDSLNPETVYETLRKMLKL